VQKNDCFGSDVAGDKALSEKMETLKKAYVQAESDSARQTILKDWEHIDLEGWE